MGRAVEANMPAGFRAAIANAGGIWNLAALLAPEDPFTGSVLLVLAQ